MPYNFNSPQLVSDFQTICGLTRTKNDDLKKKTADKKEINSEIKIDNKPLHYLFQFGSILGNEEFLTILFVFLFFNLDHQMGRRVMLIWSVILYVGQAAKDVIKWPRPASPPVIRLEKRYEEEYGMPSTHAAASFIIPFAIGYYGSDHFQLSIAFRIIFCATWCLLVSFSRLYLGMHSLLDVMVGLLYSVILTAILLEPIAWLDELCCTDGRFPIAVTLIALACGLFYPSRKESFNTARGDAVLAVCCSAGVCIASWVAFSTDAMFLHSYERLTSRSSQQNSLLIVAVLIGLFVLRMVLGGLLVVLMGELISLTVYSVVCRLYGLSPNNKVANKSMLYVDLPVRFIKYTTISFMAAFGCPLLFYYLGINSDIRHADFLPIR